MSEKKNFLYKRKIIRELYFASNLSCSDLGLRIETSLPLVTKMLNELIEESMVIETGYAPSTGGRRPLLYSLRPEAQYVVAVAMDQLFTRITILDMQHIRVSPIREIELPLTGNPKAVKRLLESIETVIAEAKISKQRIVGIGIGMPGFVDAKKGINYTFLDLGNETLAHHIAAKTGLPTFIENDASVSALAEYRFGAARDRKSSMVISPGWGVGLGMILNGEVFRGHNGFAGEFSHLPLFANNKLCSCGKSGCLETEASLLVVIEKAMQGIANGRLTQLDKLLPARNADEACRAVVSAAAKGDKFAVELLSESGYNIGRGVAILIHLLNPETVIISGRGVPAGKILQTSIQQALNEHCIPRLAANVSLEISTLGHDAEIIGAAALVMDNYLRNEKGWPVSKKQLVD
ncbi:MAG TPA: ROK family transcriptional regulator [Puia sp.]|nr:ROK family transcriptional regulator [Puia sp.]